MQKTIDERLKASREMTSVLAERVCYAAAPCPLGAFGVVMSADGILTLIMDDSIEAVIEGIKTKFPSSRPEPDQALYDAVSLVERYLDGEMVELNLPLAVGATGFQSRVWQALRRIPYGRTRSYKEVAESIGQPTASRAVASACASNPYALLVPCHRVIRLSGDMGGYRWGIARKKALLAMEKNNNGNR